MLTSEEIQKLKEKLEKEQADLIAQLNHVNEPEAVDMGSDVNHGEEEEDETEELATNIAVEHNLKERLENIKMTLFKIEQEKFGFCEKCAAEIGKNVLDVDPESRWCQSCKLGN